MTFIHVFGLFALLAYLLQVLFGMRQMKHFNQHYQALRKKGKVAIGRRSGKIKAGTIILFSVNESGIIVGAKKMQGVTVLSKFHDLTAYIGEDLHYIDTYHPLVRKENKLTQQAMENAREIYLRVEAGNYQEEPPVSPISTTLLQVQLWKNKMILKRKRSVE